jgi:hypothetical protein
MVMVLLTLGCAACVRFGYGEQTDPGDSRRDAGSPDSSGGRGGTGRGGAGGDGSSGAGGKAGAVAGCAGCDAGMGGNGDGGRDASDAGEIQLPAEAGTDAEVVEGPSDAAAADGGPAVVHPLCPERAGMLFCDGFEDPEFSRWKYTISHNGAVTRSTEHTRSGTTSLLATTGPPAQLTEARWATDVLAKQKSGDAWMRFYNWVPSEVVVTQHFSVGVMSESAVPYDGFELRILPTLVDINASNRIYPGTVSFPRDRWVCVEMHVKIDASAGEYEAYLDGALAVRSPPVNTLPADGFTAAEVGIHYAGPSQGPVEVYVDDVVVGRSRIPCD